MMDGQPTSSEAAVLKMAVCRKEEKGFTLTFQVRFVAFSAAWPIAALMTDCPCKGPERSGDGKASRNVRATDPWDLPRLIPSACDSNRPPRTAATSRSALSRWSVSRCMLCVVQHLPCLYIMCDGACGSFTFDTKSTIGIEFDLRYDTVRRVSAQAEKLGVQPGWKVIRCRSPALSGRSMHATCNMHLSSLRGHIG